MSQNNPFQIYHPRNFSKDRKINVRSVNTQIVDAAPPDATGSGNKLGSAAADWRLAAVLIFVVFLVVAVVARVFYMQIFHGTQYRMMAEGNRTRTQIIKAVRGVIYDRQEDLLVKNVPNFRLILVAPEIPRVFEPEQQQQLSTILKLVSLSTEDFERLRHNAQISAENVVLRDQLPAELALQLMVRVNEFPGLNLQVFYDRQYLGGEEFGHVLGYSGKITADEMAAANDNVYQLTDEIGKTGIEKSYEDILNGTDGRQEIEVNYRGEKLARIANTPPLPGKNIYLSIDSRLQKLLYSKIKRIVDEKKLSGGAAVALNPNNGEVLALVSYPSYDSNLFVGGVTTADYEQLTADERKPLFHRALSGEYPSGSTFKPIVATAALEEGIITAQTTIVSTGGVQIESFFFPDWKAGGHGVTNVTKALAESVNSFFYYIGGGDNQSVTGLGVQRIVNYAKKFGLGAPTGIDLPGEGDGFLPAPKWKEEFKNERWYIGDTYHLAIGQGDILVTPLQMANATAIIANRGTFYQPHLVFKLVDQSTGQEELVQPTILNSTVVSQRSLDVVARGMREAVLTGSARSLATLPVSSAAKTGTAQFGANGQTHSWFTVFAPYEQPQMVLAVIVEAGGEGNETALPIAQEVLQEYGEQLASLN